MLLLIELKLKENIDTKVITKQKNKNIIKNLFFINSKFLVRYNSKKKFKFIITKNKSGIKGPAIRANGIKHRRIEEKFKILLCSISIIILKSFELILMEILIKQETNLYKFHFL